MDSSKLGIEKFDGSNFSFWKIADQRLSVTERSSRTVDRGEAGIHDGGKVETQGSPGSRVDPFDFVKKRGVQHREREDYVRSFEGTVKHV